MKTSACCSCTLKYNGTEIYRCAGCNQQCDAAGTPLAWTVAEERDRYKAALEAVDKIAGRHHADSGSALCDIFETTGQALYPS